VLSQLVLDPVNDRTTYQIFNAFNLPWFTVDPEGNVIRYDHGYGNNIYRKYYFDARYRSIRSSELVKLLISLPIVGILQKYMTTQID